MKNFLITILLLNSFELLAAEIVEYKSTKKYDDDGKLLQEDLSYKTSSVADTNGTQADGTSNPAASQTASPAPVEPSKLAQRCIEAKENAKAVNPASEERGNRFDGSDEMNFCEKLSRGYISKLYTPKGTRSLDFKWDKYVDKYCCAKDDKDEDKFKECTTQITARAKGCESIAYLIGAYGRNWENPKHFKERNVDDDDDAPIIIAGSQQSLAASMSAGSSIKCKSEGIETLDYDACKKFQVTLDATNIAQQIANQAQEVIYQDKAIDTQTKFANEKNTATGALKATGESYKMQQNMYNQRAAVDTAKVTYLYTLFKAIPTADDIKAKCNGVTSSSSGAFASESVTPKDCLEVAVITDNGFATIKNEEVRDVMKAKLIDILTSAGSNALVASLLGKRADDVNNAIAKIDAFKPIDPFVVSEDEAKTTFCKQNPGLPQCLTGGLERTFDVMNDNIISFGEGGTGVLFRNTNTNGDGTTISSDGSDSSGSRKAVDTVGSVITAAAKDNSIEASTGATVNSGGTGTTGGGGGGGASGGGGGGGGAPAGGGGNQGGVTAAVQGKTPTYGGGGGSISVMGGFGINKKKSDGKGEENPFGKLFGKDAPKGTGVVNFRDIASQKVGSKGDNLFDMISKRYTNVTADKRLLEYELTK